MLRAPPARNRRAGTSNARRDHAGTLRAMQSAASPPPSKPPRLIVLPFYPTLLSAAYVFNLWAESSVSPFAALRALILAVVASALLTLIAWIVARRNWHAAGLAVGLLLLTISGELLRLVRLADHFEAWQAIVWWLLLALAAVLIARIGWRLVHGPKGWIRLTRGLNAFGTILLLAVFLTSLTNGSIAAGLTELRQGSGVDGLSNVAPGVSAPPSIYILLLDGYPRADTLRDLYDFDNQPFLDGLEDRRFEVAESSRSNYMFTQLTLLSMFNLRHVAEVELDGPTDTVSHTNRTIRFALNRSRGLDLLHDHGYEVVASSSGYESVVLRQADIYLDDGQANEFDRHLLRRTLLIDVLGVASPQWLPEQHRDRVLSNFEHIRLIAATPGGPRFVFVHVAAPHPPLVFEADGAAVHAPDLRKFYGDTPGLLGVPREEFIARTRDQVAYVNNAALTAVDDILAAEVTPPVILVMSDHGTRMDVTFGDPSDPEIDERFRNLFAAYTPGHNGLFGDGITPVNVLPILFNAYLGTDLPCWPDQTYANGPTTLLDLHEHPNPDGGTNPDCGNRDLASDG